MSKASIKDPSIGIRPSAKFIEFIKTLNDQSVRLPDNLQKLYEAFTEDTRPRNRSTETVSSAVSIGVYTDEERKLLLALSDETFQGSTDLDKCLESLCVHQADDDGDDNNEIHSDIETFAPDKRISKNKARQLRAKQRHKEMAKLTLNMIDMKWIYNYLCERRKIDASMPYLHELIDGSQLILPPNEIVERNPELEARCQRLKLEQDEQKYRQMTKNVDSSRTYEPEETISYQVKQINRQLIAVAQFIFSVAAGFAFGFIGVELIVGNLDFGFRLLLGIICALVIALAEIYFLAKKLNEDLDEAEQFAAAPKKNPSTGASATAAATSMAQNLKEHND